METKMAMHPLLPHHGASQYCLRDNFLLYHAVICATQEPRSIDKIAEIDSHIACANSGLSADSRTLIEHARVETQVCSRLPKYLWVDMQWPGHAILFRTSAGLCCTSASETAA